MRIQTTPGPWKFKTSVEGMRGRMKSKSPSLAQNPVGFSPVHATTESGFTESVSPSASGTRRVRETVAMTTQQLFSSLWANSVTANALEALNGTGLTASAPTREAAGATSTLDETAFKGAAHGMKVRNGRDASAK